METTTKKTIDGLTVTVTITKEVTDNTSYADGWNVNLGKKTYERIYITIEKGGKKASCGDLNFLYTRNDSGFDSTFDNPKVFARFGDTYISEAVYKIVKSVIAEAEAGCKPGEEFVTVKQAEVAKKEEDEREEQKIEAEHKKRQNNPGWCDKCQSYCFGDCEAN